MRTTSGKKISLKFLRVNPDEFPPSKTARVDLRRHKEAYIPKVPLRINTAVVAAKAEKALPLIQAIHRQLHMKRCHETPLSGAIWAAAGNPSREQKATIFRNLKAVPEIIRLRVDQTPYRYYVVSRGPLWNRKDSK